MGIEVDYICNETMESNKDADSALNFYHSSSPQVYWVFYLLWRQLLL